MPPLSTRIFPKSTELYSEPHSPKSPFDGNDTSLSPPGNPAPVRGVFPPEFTYDFTTARFYPDGPNFYRGSVDLITPVRNLSLQAAAAAGVKLN
jgi:hypothetical protein